MEPELEKLISEYPDLSEQEAKLIFIRQSAQEAFEKGEIKEATDGFFVEVKEVLDCSNMSKEDISMHIGNLEKVRDFLAAFTQGMSQGYAAEEEPKIKARRAKREQDKKKKQATSSKDKRVNDLIQMAIDGVKEPKKVSKVQKVKCDKCQSEVFSLKYHNC